MVAQMVKCLPAMWETQVQSLSQEDPLEKEMATHSSTLAWKSHGQRSLVGYSPWGRKELDTTERLSLPLESIISFCSHRLPCCLRSYLRPDNPDYGKCTNLDSGHCIKKVMEPNNV